MVVGQPEYFRDMLGNEEFLAAEKRIRSLKHNWDDEGALPVSETTWTRVKCFLSDSLKALWDNRQVNLQIPIISATSDGGVDLLWDTSECVLLVHVPLELTNTVSYYGRNKQERGNQAEIKGLINYYVYDALFVFGWLNGVRMDSPTTAVPI